MTSVKNSYSVLQLDADSVQNLQSLSFSSIYMMALRERRGENETRVTLMESTSRRGNANFDVLSTFGESPTSMLQT